MLNRYLLFVLVWSCLFSTLGFAADFHLQALGVGGGEVEDDLSSFRLLDQWQGATTSILLDGGSPSCGMARRVERQNPGVDIRPLLEREWNHLGLVLLTHGHLDHTAGFILMTPRLLYRPFSGREPFAVAGMEPTIAQLRKYFFNGEMWSDFSQFKPLPLFQWHHLNIGKWHSFGPVEVMAVPVTHPIPCAAYILKKGAKKMSRGWSIVEIPAPPSASGSSFAPTCEKSVVS